MQSTKLLFLSWCLLLTLEPCLGQNDTVPTSEDGSTNDDKVSTDTGTPTATNNTSSSTNTTKESSSGESNEQNATDSPSSSSSSSEEHGDSHHHHHNGRPARTGEFPYQLQLIYKGRHGHCGGALVISPSSGKQVGITAAHCLDGRSAKDFKIHAGSNIIHDKHAQKLSVKRLVVHQRYEADHYAYDIAVIHFEGQFHLDGTVQPLALPKKNQAVRKNVVVTGWGATLGGDDILIHGGTPEVLMALRLPVVPQKKCEKLFRKAAEEEIITEMNLCAGKLKKDAMTCHGDNGGPAMAEDKKGNRFLAGVVSFGTKGCGKANGLPAVFARVSTFIDWIGSASSATNEEDSDSDSDEGLSHRSLHHNHDYDSDYEYEDPKLYHAMYF